MQNIPKQLNSRYEIEERYKNKDWRDAMYTSVCETPGGLPEAVRVLYRKSGELISVETLRKQLLHLDDEAISIDAVVLLTDWMEDRGHPDPQAWLQCMSAQHGLKLVRRLAKVSGPDRANAVESKTSARTFVNFAAMEPRERINHLKSLLKPNKAQGLDLSESRAMENALTIEITNVQELKKQVKCLQEKLRVYQTQTDQLQQAQEENAALRAKIQEQTVKEGSPTGYVQDLNFYHTNVYLQLICEVQHHFLKPGLFDIDKPESWPRQDNVFEWLNNRAVLDLTDKRAIDRAAFPFFRANKKPVTLKVKT